MFVFHRMLQDRVDQIFTKPNLDVTVNDPKVKIPFQPCSGANISKLGLSKLRWKILSQAVRQGFNLKPCLGSIRQFSGFNIFEVRELYSDEYGKWFQFVSKDKKNLVSIKVRILTLKLSTQEIINGFDNTGNICIWPSEEILAYYCSKNVNLFENKIVCVLGGGMTCLSGVIVGSSSTPKHVILTDGNQRCVENVIKIVNANSLNFGSTKMECRLLRWSDKDGSLDLNESVDIILNADCLYFEDCHQALIHTIFRLLKHSGLAIILAPNRGSSLLKFYNLAKAVFKIKKLLIYDPIIWKHHQILLNSNHSNIYSSDIHYPIMIMLRKEKEN
jgi:uncharacterized protein C2orf34 homolog